MGVEKVKFTWITWTDEFDSKINQGTPANLGRLDVFSLTPIRQQFHRYLINKMWAEYHPKDQPYEYLEDYDSEDGNLEDFFKNACKIVDDRFTYKTENFFCAKSISEKVNQELKTGDF